MARRASSTKRPPPSRNAARCRSCSTARPAYRARLPKRRRQPMRRENAAGGMEGGRPKAGRPASRKHRKAPLRLMPSPWNAAAVPPPKPAPKADSPRDVLPGSHRQPKVPLPLSLKQESAVAVVQLRQVPMEGGPKGDRPAGHRRRSASRRHAVRASAKRRSQGA